MRMNRKAFTLLELLVVLAVITIIGTMTFGVIGNIAESNRRLNCTTNLAQIYGAARLYAQDYDGQLPYYKPDASVVPDTIRPSSDDDNFSGLWLLTRYRNGNLSGYLRSEEKFHCPSDRIHLTGTDMPAGSTIYNSYQRLDDIKANSDSTNFPQTYATFRTANADMRKRQLTYFDGTNVNETRRVSDTTVITWCRYHRKYNSTSPGDTTNPTSTTERDNVLFFDGRVQSLPLVQNVVDTSNVDGICKAWERVPTQMENSLESAANCQPAN